MSVRFGLLALLAQGDKYGAQLRSDFEQRTGGTWPLNIGQVYTTLDRLERDGLVEQDEPDPEGRIVYRLTEPGREEISGWWSTPVNHDTAPRNELTIKLALAVTVPDVDVAAVVQTQRTASIKHLRDLTTLKAQALQQEPIDENSPLTPPAPVDPQSDLAWLLVLENLIFAAEGEVRWLDHVESMLARAKGDPAAFSLPPVPAQSKDMTRASAG